MSRRSVYAALIAFFIFFPLSLMGYKLFVLDYPLAALIPAVSYQVEVSMEVDGHGENVFATTFLPRSDHRQVITGESNDSPGFAMDIESDDLNRKAIWNGTQVTGQQAIHYRFSAQGQHVKYQIPPTLAIPSAYPPEFRPYLAEEEGIQVSNPLVAKKVAQLFPKGNPTLLEAVTVIHRHLQDEFKNKNFSGFTDALTALKLGEASCNGKGRLFVALARKLNIPARLVGGLVMEQGSKRVSHQWVELYINGHWVPFDTINDHFAELPANFLSLYTGDMVLFKHTSNVNFQYLFKMNKRLVPRVEAQESLKGSVLNIFNLYSVFDRIGVSQNLLKIILMIPLGALVVVICRNVIGLETFGTFLPALIASASRETGLFWGMVGFISIIGFTSLLRKGLDWLQLLHSPKMAIMLSVVVVCLLMITVVGVRFDLFDLAHMSLFPIAILAITAERFALIEEEQGFVKAAKMMGTTLVVISLCYVVMDSQFLQSMMLAFQELLLVLIALNLWLGKWIGMRVMEFLRFRMLVFKQGETSA